MKKKSTIHTVLAALFCLGAFFSASAQNDSILAADNVAQNFGTPNTRTVYDTVIMPHSLSAYSQINLHIYLTCPSGGDPYDRLAHVRLGNLQGTHWYEIARYITPFGVSCDFVFDVTDYRYMLTDTIVLESFIDTWVNPAWLVTMQFEMTAGTPNPDLIQIDSMWNNYGMVYGDTTQVTPNPSYLATIHSGADSVKIRVTSTGHGQGNLDNAAEFFQTIDSVHLNDSVYFLQNVWRTDCSTAPCVPQNGTYQYSRAGWCPGKSVVPDNFEVPSTFGAGQSVQVGYSLQSYFNTCSPNDPSCVTNANCPSCAYNNNGHTQPYYAIDGQLITYYRNTTGVANVSQSDITIRPNPGKGLYNLHVGGISGTCAITVYDYLGNVILAKEVSTIESTFNLQDAPQGVYFVKVQDNQSAKTLKVVKE